jgi:hypothetical protein
MPTNRLRKKRVSKNRIPFHLTEQYFQDLTMRDFLNNGGNSVYADAPNEEEIVLLREFKKCKCDFGKWLKFREGSK